ncbi:MAG: hypothetical protein H0U74_17750 [Bradymonadaceae bacterium]|nr:hypothetical protein [Lujinxingiaceae bacterium]
MSSITVDDIVTIDQKNPDDWNAYEKMKSITKSEPEGTLSQLLWQAFKGDRLNLARYRGAWHVLAEPANAYDGDAFLKLTHAIAIWDAKQSYPSWSDSDLPGFSNYLDALLKAKSGDDAFFQRLAANWTTLPSPLRESLGAKLVGLGFLEASVLPDALIETLAARFVQTEYPFWGEGLPCWSDEIWQAALLSAALSPAVSTIKSDKIFAQLVEVAAPAGVAILACKMAMTTDKRLPAIETIGQRGESVIPALELALGELEDFSDSREHYAAFHLVLGYCRACQLANKTPSAHLDAKIAGFASAFQPGWSGGNFREWQAHIQSLVALVPKERLGPLIAAGPKLPWLLIGAAPTDEVCQRTVDTLVTITSDPFYGFDVHRDIGLHALGTAVVPALCAALDRGDGGSQRGAMIGVLGATADDRAAATLVALLDEKTKGLREGAKHALSALSVQAVCAHLGSALNSRKKDTRLAAAEILRAMAPAREAFELAQTQLDSEKLADIQVILQAVQRPADEINDETADEGITSELRAEIFVALRDSNGKDWPKYVAHGEGIVEIFIATLAERFQGEIAYFNDAIQYHLAEMLGHFADSPTARRALTDILGAFRSAAVQGNVDIFIKHVPSFPADLAEAVIAGRIQRPANFGKPPYYGTPPYYSSAFTDLHALCWLFLMYPELAWEAALSGLTHSEESVRNVCMDFVLLSKERIDVNTHVLPLLKSRTKDMRISGARFLGSLASAEHLPLREEALKREKVREVRDLLQDAIVRVHAQGLDVAAFAQDPDGDARLDARLAGLVARELPTAVETAWTGLGALHWKSGAALSDGARRWFVSEALNESANEQGVKVREVRARLVDQDCHALCDNN